MSSGCTTTHPHLILEYQYLYPTLHKVIVTLIYFLKDLRLFLHLVDNLSNIWQCIFLPFKFRIPTISSNGHQLYLLNFLARSNINVKIVLNINNNNRLSGRENISSNSLNFNFFAKICSLKLLQTSYNLAWLVPHSGFEICLHIACIIVIKDSSKDSTARVRNNPFLMDDVEYKILFHIFE